MVITKTGESQNFAYTGGMQEFIVPIDGLYLLEVWGAQGGDYGSYYNKPGGLGGYTKGYVLLKKGNKLYICVGGAGRQYGAPNGTEYSVNGGYNGGGGAIGVGGRYVKSTGGGATHIGTFNSTLAAHGNTTGLYVVAGGGGAACGRNGDNPNGYAKGSGGSGGGLNGGDGVASVYGNIARGGGQSPLTTENLFGTAGNITGAYAGAGGGGLYGGFGGEQSGSGGGSGYIGGVPIIIYRGKEYASETKNGVNSGNGKAAITLVGKSVPPVYLGSDEIVAIYIGNKEITDIKIG